MHTAESTIETLRRFNISEADLLHWEHELGLDIPMTTYGYKDYSPHHINLFKNVKKHLALGRTLDEIKRLISLPPIEDAQPEATHTVIASMEEGDSELIDVINTPLPSENKSIEPIKSNPYASIPSRPEAETNAPKEEPSSTPSQKSVPIASAYTAGQGAASVVALVNKLTEEKDQLYKKLLETEKLNSHLFSANNMFHRKVKELNTSISTLKEQSNENENFKLMDDKAKLHKQLISAERSIQEKEQELLNQCREMEELLVQVNTLETRIENLKKPFEADCFIGDWLEKGELLETSYDNFGINIEKERVRLFRISEAPSRLYGNTGVISTTYQYETNKLWKRVETLTATLDEAGENLNGELCAEYILDGVPVAKAIYSISCSRNR